MILLVLPVVGAFLRLYRLEDLTGSNGDQGRDVTIIQNLANLRAMLDELLSAGA